MTIKKEYLITRQGQTFVLYPGLLDEAHQQNLVGIHTTLIQIPTAENGHTAIMMATANFADGRSFTGIGDANPNNVSKPMVNCLLRMAETRAKGRALRDGINGQNGMPDDVADYEDESDVAQSQPRPQPQSQTRTQPQPVSKAPIVTKPKLENISTEPITEKARNVLSDMYTKLDLSDEQIEKHIKQVTGGQKKATNQLNTTEATVLYRLLKNHLPENQTVGVA